VAVAFVLDIELERRKHGEALADRGDARLAHGSTRRNGRTLTLA
jgi:hypothetical protein